jgi:hypothetical protein
MVAIVPDAAVAVPRPFEETRRAMAAETPHEPTVQEFYRDAGRSEEQIDALLDESLAPR